MIRYWFARANRQTQLCRAFIFNRNVATKQGHHPKTNLFHHRAVTTHRRPLTATGLLPAMSRRGTCKAEVLRE